jgi:CHAD domain-containing protein
MNRYKIKNLDPEKKFKKNAKIILDSKLNHIFSDIDKFFKDDSPDNLHKLRLSFRRFRYSMELFYDCYDKAEFKLMYSIIKKMLDLIGEARDLDVLDFKVEEIAKKNNLEIPAEFFEKIISSQKNTRHEIKIELIHFIANETVNNFFINKK